MIRKENEIADAIMGICPKCGKHKKLEWGHIDYDPNNDNVAHRQNGRLICHKCNCNEPGIAPELTTKERSKVATRDYKRRNVETIETSEKWEGERTNGSFALMQMHNHRTGHTTYGINIKISGLVKQEEIRQ